MLAGTDFPRNLELREILQVGPCKTRIQSYTNTSLLGEKKYVLTYSTVIQKTIKKT